MDLSQYLDLFVAEAREHIGAASELAAGMDDGAGVEGGLRELFRHVHSVKGMAASMGFSAMSALAHDAESLMDQLRQGHMAPRQHTGRILTDALSCLERIVRIARDNAKGTEETSSATLGQNASMHALSASAHELARTSDQMKSLISTFRLRD